MTQVSSSVEGSQWLSKSRNEPLSEESVSPPSLERNGVVPSLKIIAIGIAFALVCSLCLASTPPEKAKILGPPVPYIIYGYTFDEDDSILPSCALKVVNRATMNSSIVTSDSEGRYQFDLSSLSGGYQTGEVIWLLGNKTTEIGLNKTSVTGSGGKWLNLTLSAHTPIRIECNSDFDAMHGVSGGSGTAIDPYVLENRDISGSGYGYCIYVGNTTDHFMVRNCQLHNAWRTYASDHGLTLFNVSNAGIWNNTASSNHFAGMLMYSSSNNTISSNKAFGNLYGIVLQYSNGNAISNNSVYSNGNAGISMEASSNNEVSNNIVTSDGTDGIGVYTSSNGNEIANNTVTGTVHGIRSQSCQYNMMLDNNVSSNGYGIYMFTSSNNNIVINNTCSYNSQYGMYLSGGSGNTLTDNICSGSSQGGIFLDPSSSTRNAIVNNTCSNNSGSGIYVRYPGHSNFGNTISNNTCSYNTQYGMYVTGSANELWNNTCSHNSQVGMYLFGGGPYTVSNNTCSYNYEGIELYGVSFSPLSNNICSYNSQSGMYVTGAGFNTLSNNTCSSSGDGIYLHSTTSNDLINNNCSSNSRYGIRLESASNYNALINNTASSNSASGIYLLQSSGNTLSNNTCESNVNHGIALVASSSNVISNNTCGWNSEHGFYLELYISASNSNSICWNQFHDNHGQGAVIGGASGNVFWNNTFTDNLGYGVSITSGSNSMLRNNTFTGNNGAGSAYDPSHVQARDTGTNNRWNSSDGHGNYWSDWTRPDTNGDSVVDSPYMFTSNQDNYPKADHAWACNSTIHLLPGWNFVSVPLSDFSYNASTLGLASGDMVCKWNSSAQMYSTYVVGASPPSYDFELGLSTGYFIWVSAEEELTLLGDSSNKYASYSVSLDVPVGGGWVSVGWTSFDDSRHASDLASYVSGTNVKFVCKYNSSIAQYLVYVIGFSPPVYDFEILPIDAMWVWVDATGGTLTYSP